MSWMLTLFLWVLALMGVVACGLCGGLETGIYSLNRVRLRLLVHQGEKRARIIESLLAQRASLITTLLIGANVATNIASSAGGLLLDARQMAHWKIVLLDVLIVTPVLFIFSEVLPKDLFAVYADKLVYPFARPLEWMRKFFTVIPLLPLVQFISQGVMKLLNIHDYGALAHGRYQINLLMKETVGMGLLSDEQSAIAERVLGLNERRVGDEAVPWERVIKIHINDPPASLWELANRTSVSRFPVVDTSGNVVGLVSLYDVLRHTPQTCPPIRQLVRPVQTIDEATPLRAAMARFHNGAARLAIVTRNGRPIGLVTVKDLVEPITGELASW